VPCLNMTRTVQEGRRWRTRPHFKRSTNGDSDRAVVGSGSLSPSQVEGLSVGLRGEQKKRNCRKFILRGLLNRGSCVRNRACRYLEGHSAHFGDWNCQIANLWTAITSVPLEVRWRLPPPPSRMFNSPMILLSSGWSGLKWSWEEWSCSLQT
jgi:hypothetical protein